jgi:cytochrome c-type biogenesis protein
MDFLASLGTSGVPLLAATAVGLLMAISPCTLATSVVAVTYLAGETSGRWRFVAAASLYTLGRMVIYTGLAFSIVWLGLNTREISVFFQQYGERLLAPVLIVAGLWMLGLVPAIQWPDIFHRVREHVTGAPARRSALSAFLLGMFLSLSFCPINVVLFFGLLVPLAYRAGDPILIPSLFAVVSTIPVLVASLVIVTSARHFGRTLALLQDVNLWMQRVAGVVFIAAGVYYIPRFLGL